MGEDFNICETVKNRQKWNGPVLADNFGERQEVQQLVDRIGKAENPRDGGGPGTAQAELPPENLAAKEQGQRKNKGASQVAGCHARHRNGAPIKAQEKAKRSSQDGKADAGPEKTPRQLVRRTPAQAAKHKQGNL